MPTAKKLSVLFAVVTVLLILITAGLYLRTSDNPLLLMPTLKQADRQTEDLMDALCSGRDAEAGALMYGQPQLNQSHEFSSEVYDILWHYYRGNMSFAFSGSCYVSASGVFRDVTVTAPDLKQIVPLIETRADALLTEYLAQPEAQETAYDEEGYLLEDVLTQILCEAADQILGDPCPSATLQLTLELVRKNGRWTVLPNQTLINFISGSM